MFITKTREKILCLFFNRPELRIHQRGIVRKARVNPQNAHKYLKEFVRDGLLLRSESPQFSLYRINPKNAYLFKIFELFELKKKEDFCSKNNLLARRLLKYMQILRRLSENEVQLIILYGPAARGEWTEESAVDILTVTPARVGPKKMTQIHEEAAKRVRFMLHISSSNFTMEDVNFFPELWKDRIVLYNEYLFWHMIRESKTNGKRLI